MLPEGNPRRLGQVLGAAAMVVYSSGRGLCGSAGLRKSPRVLPKRPMSYPRLHPSGWALTMVNSTHSPLQLGFTAGCAPGPIHIHVGAAPYMLGLPVLPAHVAQWLLRDPGVPPGTLGRSRPSGWEEGDQPRRWGQGRQGVRKGEEGNQGGLGS